MQALDTLPIDNSKNYRIRLSKDGRFFALQSDGISIYDRQEKKIVSELPVGGNEFIFSDDNKRLYIAEGSGADRMSIWDIATQQRIYVDEGTSHSTIALSTNEEYVATCVSRFVIMFNGSKLTDVREIRGDEQSVIYPNPATQSVTLLLAQPTILQRCTLIDSRGSIVQEIQTSDTPQTQVSFSVSGYSVGAYTLVARTAQQKVLTFRLIIH